MGANGRKLSDLCGEATPKSMDADAVSETARAAIYFKENGVNQIGM